MIPAGGDHTVRILRTSREAPQGEETYRCWSTRFRRKKPARTTGVRLQLCYSVPVFAGAPVNGPTPKVDFSLENVPAPGAVDGKGTRLVLHGSNEDTAHAQLSQVRIEWADGRTTDVAPGLLGYALAHASRQWPVADAARRDRARDHQRHAGDGESDTR